MKTWVKVLIIVVVVIVGISAFLYFYPPMPLYIYRTENIVDEFLAAYSNGDTAVNLYLQGDDTKFSEVLKRMDKCFKKFRRIHPPPGAKLDYEQLEKAFLLSVNAMVSRIIEDDVDTRRIYITRSRNAWYDWKETRKKLKE